MYQENSEKNEEWLFKLLFKDRFSLIMPINAKHLVSVWDNH